MTVHLGVFVTHPIQYYTPWFRYLMHQIDIVVFYAHRQDAQGHSVSGFGVAFEWDTPLLEGYPHRWLTNVARHPSVVSFAGCDTPDVYALLRQKPFDACLIFGWGHKSSLQAIHACWRYGIPVLMRGDSQLTTRRSRLKTIVKYLPYRWFLPRLSAHLYVGQRNKAYLRYYGVREEQLFFVPHFVDNDYFATHVQEIARHGKQLALRDHLGIPRHTFVVLYVGKFTPVKRPQDFVRAVVKIRQLSHTIPVHAILVGDGPLRLELQALAQPAADRIHFVGFRNQSELPLFYQTADVLILPGDETWGLVVNEAMACGRPAIVSEAAGCSPDLIVEGQTGFTYPPGNVEVLAQRILDLQQLCIHQPTIVEQAVAQKIAAYSFQRATAGLEQALTIVT